MLIPEELQAGDILLYSPTDWIGLLISMKTWTMLSHVELYVGVGRVIAARPQGVDIYPERIDSSLRYVRRPIMPNKTQFNIRGAMAAVKPLLGQPYEIAGLFSFYIPWMHRHRATRVCSPVVTVALRAGGCEPFNPSVDPDDVAPSMLWQSSELTTVWDRDKLY